MCENALAMISNMTDGDMAATVAEGRMLTSRCDGFMEWMMAGDRRLLQSTQMAADVMVASNGSGNFSTITEAVVVAPVKSK
ncbi:Pectinesterase/pectinesterase inhibitor U1 [Dendrobium catenatum]|uniref:Pectinesterase/pectinesterase inhibitor U1 n=1 Tax=Dendrobium catenatum TaxID=906689 RepID=A0A2I0XJD9_9ASPA|nr:Pectinesterase/pectinesterase inhibitor U1 [Dendrobium catenatum]